MNVDKITDAAEKIQSVNVGGMEIADLFGTAKALEEVESAGRIPLMIIFPSDLFDDLFNDGEFADNVTKFAEIQNRHTKSMLEEYAAWKVLKLESKKKK